MSAMDQSTVRQTIPFDEDALTGKISDVIAALVAVRAQAPEEYRDTVEIEVEAEPSWESSAVLEAKVFYVRPETDAEMADRQCREEGRVRYKLDQERRQYEWLKAKFG